MSQPRKQKSHYLSSGFNYTFLISTIYWTVNSFRLEELYYIHNLDILVLINVNNVLFYLPLYLLFWLNSLYLF